MKMRLIGLALLMTGVVHAQEVEFQVELMNRVGTETSRKGDLVSARIIAPASFQGNMLEGKITESISGAKVRGDSILDIDFDMMRHANMVTPLSSRIKSVSNSKGNVNVDEEGRIVGRAGNSNQSSRTSGLGRALGGLAGNRAARVGNAVDNAASALFRVSSDAPNLRFDPGSKFVLMASSRSGPALAGLASSQPAGAAAPAPASPPAEATSSAPPAPAPAPQNAAGQPNLTLVKDEFIPGDNTIFYDDFTDMNPGDAPPHFKVRGASPDLMDGEGFRQLTISANSKLYPNLKALPQNFTIESELKKTGSGGGAMYMKFLSKNKEILQWAVSAGSDGLDFVVSLRAPFQELGRKRAKISYDQTFKVALWVQNGRLRVYLNGQKQLDFNQVEMPAIDSVEMEIGITGKTSLGFRTMRFAESTPDFSQILMSSGRYIARGILFDTDRDVLKPESAPVIRLIAQALEKNPSLKLLIEGHTDSVGDATHNLDLSKRRAEAVKAVLVAQFNVDASRLSTNGLGSTKPVDTNDTPQGRAQNRRVELVKQ
ncbi:MAG: OmpA family protein [Acidobacteriota bacterium]|nr:OmpA family protein [Acidobacteriota bacterium]